MCSVFRLSRSLCGTGVDDNGGGDEEQEEKEGEEMSFSVNI